MIENVVGINLPRIASLENQTADKHRHYDAKIAQLEQWLDRELQRRRLEAEAYETAGSPDVPSHRGAGSLPRPSAPAAATSTTPHDFYGLDSLEQLEKQTQTGTSISMPQPTSVIIQADIGSQSLQPPITFPPIEQTVDELLQRLMTIEEHLRMTSCDAASAMLGLTTQQMSREEPGHPLTATSIAHLPMPRWEIHMLFSSSFPACDTLWGQDLALRDSSPYSHLTRPHPYPGALDHVLREVHLQYQAHPM